MVERLFKEKEWTEKKVTGKKEYSVEVMVYREWM